MGNNCVKLFPGNIQELGLATVNRQGEYERLLAAG